MRHQSKGLHKLPPRPAVVARYARKLAVSALACALCALFPLSGPAVAEDFVIANGGGGGGGGSAVHREGGGGGGNGMSKLDITQQYIANVISGTNGGNGTSGGGSGLGKGGDGGVGDPGQDSLDTNSPGAWPSTNRPGGASPFGHGGGGGGGGEYMTDAATSGGFGGDEGQDGMLAGGAEWNGVIVGRTYDNVILAGGGGGAAGGGGNGGDVYYNTFNIDRDLSINGMLIMVGGDGGSNHVSGKVGGFGGDVELQGGTHNITVNGQAILAGGNGGLGANGGAKGGDVSLTAGTLSLGDHFVVLSGGGNANGGDGGGLSLNVDTLVANSSTGQSFEFTTYGGAFDVSVNTLRLDGNLDIAVNNMNGKAGKNLVFREIHLNGDGRAMAISSNNPFGFNENLRAIRVSGKNTSIISWQYTTNLTSFSGKELVFNMPSNTAVGDTMLTIQQSTPGTAVDLSGLALTVNGVPGGLKAGDKVYLLKIVNGQLVNYSALDGMVINSAFGDIYTLGFAGNDSMYLGIKPDDVVIVEKLKAERFKPLAQSRLGALGFLNQGSDMALSEVLPSLKREAPDSGLIPFVNVRMSDSRYDSGGRIKADGINMVTGLGWGQVFDNGMRWTSGFFMEFGWGDMDSRTGFAGQETVKGKGDSEYIGGGLLTRLDIGNGLYFDASGRFGKVDVDFHSDNIDLGKRYGYDESVWYYGAHAGAGYELPLGQAATLDLQGRFIWTRLDSDSFDAGDEKIRFDSLDSYRLRLGGRVDINAFECVTPYLGAAWEHEFDAKQRTKVNGNSIKTVDLEGDSIIGELGFRISPTQLPALHLDLNVQAYDGEREGFSGGLRFKYEF